MYSLFPLPNLSSLLASSSQNYANPMFREIFPIVLYGIGILVGGYVVFMVWNSLVTLFWEFVDSRGSGKYSSPNFHQGTFIRRVKSMDEIKKAKSSSPKVVFIDPDSDFFRKK